MNKNNDLFLHISIRNGKFNIKIDDNSDTENEYLFPITHHLNDIQERKTPISLFEMIISIFNQFSTNLGMTMSYRYISDNDLEILITNQDFHSYVILFKLYYILGETVSTPDDMPSYKFASNIIDIKTYESSLTKGNISYPYAPVFSSITKILSNQRG